MHPARPGLLLDVVEASVDHRIERIELALGPARRRIPTPSRRAVASPIAPGVAPWTALVAPRAALITPGIAARIAAGSRVAARLARCALVRGVTALALRPAISLPPCALPAGAGPPFARWGARTRGRAGPGRRIAWRRAPTPPVARPRGPGPGLRGGRRLA
jgi:hypothetical protein